MPADRPERFPTANASGADALVFDFENAVAPGKKEAARAAAAIWLERKRSIPVFVRVNPLESGLTKADVDAMLSGRPDGASSVEDLKELIGGARIPTLPIAAETPAGIFQPWTLRAVKDHLAGVTWGAEDLSAAVASRETDGNLTAPYEIARALTLFAARAAAVPAIETIFPRIAAADQLSAYVARAAREGFAGMLAIHPAQVDGIKWGFKPGLEELAAAEEIVALFAADPTVGALRHRRTMIDRPHLTQALRLLSRRNKPRYENTSLQIR